MPARVVYFLNGPNANLYGLDATGVYGTESFPQIEARCRRHADGSASRSISASPTTRAC